MSAPHASGDRPTAPHPSTRTTFDRRRLLLVATAALFASCMGDDDSDTPTSLALTTSTPPLSQTPSAVPSPSSIWLPTIDTEASRVPSVAPSASATLTAAPSRTAGVTPTTTSAPPPVLVDASTPTPSPTPEPPSDRLVIPSIGVRARIETKGLSAERLMQIPDNPYNVAWYDFSTWPGDKSALGSGGNAVFAGHVDDIRVGHAVFWDLNRLGIDGEVRLDLLDGRSVRYRVVRTFTLSSDDPADRAILPTGVDTITLITCTGNYVPSGQKYDARLIVQAERVPE
jgi:LPXTG-site transpeptidase (sortase) family protein